MGMFCNSMVDANHESKHTSINPLTTDDAFWRWLTWAACYQLVQSVLKIGFVLAKRWDGGSGWVSARGAMHMAAALVGCRTALVGTDWTISRFVSTNGHRNHSFPVVGAPFLVHCRQFSVRWNVYWLESPTIESLLISGCG